jgi:ribosomal protein L40E
MKWEDAKALGLKRYFSDRVCKKCGTPNPERYVCNQACLSCATTAIKELGKRTKTILPLEEIPETREAAIAMGSKYYRPATPCARGHISRRRTSTRVCLKCAAAQQREKTQRIGITRIVRWVDHRIVADLDRSIEALTAALMLELPETHPLIAINAMLEKGLNYPEGHVLNMKEPKDVFGVKPRNGNGSRWDDTGD